MNWFLAWVFIVIVYIFALSFVEIDPIMTDFHRINGKMYIEYNDTLYLIPENEILED